MIFGLNAIAVFIKHDGNNNLSGQAKLCSNNISGKEKIYMLHQQQGMTLLEMLIALAIAAIMLTVVAPNVQTIMAKNKTTAEINELSAALQYARYTAVDQSATTIVCPSSDFSNCSDNWNKAKIVFIDNNGNGDRDNSEPLLLATQSVSGSHNMTGPSDPVEFSETGGTNAATSIKICPDNNDVLYAKSINLNAQGRVRVSVDSNRDGVYEDTDGNPLSCS